jgi:hypothetical protein
LATGVFSICFSLIYPQDVISQSTENAPKKAEEIEDLLLQAKEKIEEAKQSELQLANLTILSNSSYVDSSGVLHVVGEVYNNMTSDTTTHVQIIATFYDPTNTVVETNNTFTNPFVIPPKDKAPFDLTLTSGSIPMEDVSHYGLELIWQKEEDKDFFHPLLLCYVTMQKLKAFIICNQAVTFKDLQKFVQSLCLFQYTFLDLIPWQLYTLLWDEVHSTWQLLISKFF